MPQRAYAFWMPVERVMCAYVSVLSEHVKFLRKVKTPGNAYDSTLGPHTVYTYTSFRMTISIVSRQNAHSLNWKIIHPRSGGMVQRDDGLNR